MVWWPARHSRGRLETQAGEDHQHVAFHTCGTVLRSQHARRVRTSGKARGLERPRQRRHGPLFVWCACGHPPHGQGAGWTSKMGSGLALVLRPGSRPHACVTHTAVGSELKASIQALPWTTIARDASKDVVNGNGSPRWGTSGGWEPWSWICPEIFLK